MFWVSNLRYCRINRIITIKGLWRGLDCRDRGLDELEYNNIIRKDQHVYRFLLAKSLFLPDKFSIISTNHF